MVRMSRMQMARLRTRVDKRRETLRRAEYERKELIRRREHAARTRAAQEEYQRKLAEYEKKKAQYEREKAEYERQKKEAEEAEIRRRNIMAYRIRMGMAKPSPYKPAWVIEAEAERGIPSKGVIELKTGQTKAEFIKKHPQYAKGYRFVEKPTEPKPEPYVEKKEMIRQLWAEAAAKELYPKTKTGYIYQVREEKGKTIVTERYAPDKYAISVVAQELAQARYNQPLSRLKSDQQKALTDEARKAVREQITLERKDRGYFYLSQLGAQARLGDFFGTGTIVGTAGTLAVRKPSEYKKSLRIAAIGQFTERAVYRTLAKEQFGLFREARKRPTYLMFREGDPLRPTLLGEAGYLGAFESAFAFGFPAAKELISTSKFAMKHYKAFGYAGKVGRLGVWGGLTTVGGVMAYTGREAAKAGEYAGAKQYGYGALITAVALPKTIRAGVDVAYPPAKPVREGVYMMKMGRKELLLKKVSSEYVTPREEARLMGKRVSYVHAADRPIAFEKGKAKVIEEYVRAGAGIRRTKMGEFYMYGAPPEKATGKAQAYMYYLGLGSRKEVKQLSPLEYALAKVRGKSVKYQFGMGYVYVFPKEKVGVIPARQLIKSEKGLATWLRTKAPKGVWPAPETLKGASAEYQLIAPPETPFALTGKQWRVSIEGTPIRVFETRFVTGKEGIPKEVPALSPLEKILSGIPSKRRYYGIYEPRRALYPPVTRFRVTERAEMRVLPRKRIDYRAPLRITARAREEPRITERPRFDLRLPIRPRITPYRAGRYVAGRVPIRLPPAAPLFGLKMKKPKILRTKRKYKYEPSLAGIILRKPIKKAPIGKLTGIKLRPPVKRKKDWLLRL